jgi:hypothetical protein
MHGHGPTVASLRRRGHVSTLHIAHNLPSEWWGSTRVEDLLPRPYSGQKAENSFGFEDLRAGQHSDCDYNDRLVHITTA